MSSHLSLAHFWPGNMSDSAIDLDHDGNPVKKNATRRDQVNIAFGTGEVWILGRWDWEPFCEGLRSRG